MTMADYTIVYLVIFTPETLSEKRDHGNNDSEDSHTSYSDNNYGHVMITDNTMIPGNVVGYSDCRREALVYYWRKTDGILISMFLHVEKAEDRKHIHR